MEKIVIFIMSALILSVSAGHDNAHYNFEYGVHDPHTNDIKSQHEHRIGHNVAGGYTLKEADGTTRVVKYKSDPHTGFEAVVERMGYAHHPAQYGHGYGHGHDQGFGGATSYVGTIHWSNQGPEEHGYLPGSTKNYHY